MTSMGGLTVMNGEMDIIKQSKILQSIFKKMKSYYADGTMCSMSESIIGDNVCDDILKYLKGMRGENK